jgi:hypothetical protein
MISIVPHVGIARALSQNRPGARARIGVEKRLLYVGRAGRLLRGSLLDMQKLLSEELRNQLVYKGRWRVVVTLDE